MPQKYRTSFHAKQLTVFFGETDSIISNINPIQILYFFPSLFLLVGAGLSAADAIIAALNKGLSVVHVFRRSANDRRLIFNNLPAAIYPEYHEIHRMMAKKQSRRGYQPYGQHHVVKIGKMPQRYRTRY